MTKYFKTINENRLLLRICLHKIKFDLYPYI